MLSWIVARSMLAALVGQPANVGRRTARDVVGGCVYEMVTDAVGWRARPQFWKSILRCGGRADGAGVNVLRSTLPGRRRSSTKVDEVVSRVVERHVVEGPRCRRRC